MKKKILSIITVGALYIFFVFSFSFVDIIQIVEKILTEIGLKDGPSPTVDVYYNTGADPIPDPPFPPPPPPPPLDG